MKIQLTEDHITNGSIRDHMHGCYSSSTGRTVSRFPTPEDHIGD